MDQSRQRLELYVQLPCIIIIRELILIQSKYPRVRLVQIEI
jgi:hypothetical protein